MDDYLGNLEQMLLLAFSKWYFWLVVVVAIAFLLIKRG